MDPLEKMLGTKDYRALIERWRGQRFVLGAQARVSWSYKARVHKRAADVLFQVAVAANRRHIERVVAEPPGKPGESTSRPMTVAEYSDMIDTGLIAESLLFSGFAIENLLKGYLLATRPELLRN